MTTPIVSLINSETETLIENGGFEEEAPLLSRDARVITATVTLDTPLSLHQTPSVYLDIGSSVTLDVGGGIILEGPIQRVPNTEIEGSIYGVRVEAEPLLIGLEIEGGAPLSASYREISFFRGRQYVFSCFVLSRSGGTHSLILTDTLNNEIAREDLTISPGDWAWQRVSIAFEVPVTGTYRMYLAVDPSSEYLDTDNWSLSAGFPMIVERITGLHAPEIEHITTPYGGIDGSYWHQSRVPPRQITIHGYIDAEDDESLLQQRDDLWQIVNPRRLTGGSLATLVYQPTDDTNEVSYIDVVYQSGLEDVGSFIDPEIFLTFTCPNPFFAAPTSNVISMNVGFIAPMGTHRLSSNTLKNIRISTGKWIAVNISTLGAYYDSETDFILGGGNNYLYLGGESEGGVPVLIPE